MSSKTLLKTIAIAALIAGGATGPAAAATATEGAQREALLPLKEPIRPRRAVHALPCGLLAIGAAPRSAPAVEAAPLLAVGGAMLEESRAVRHGSAEVDLRLRVLDGPVISTRLTSAPTLIARLGRMGPAPLTIDAPTLHRSRLARALAAR
ncbi:MAG: hypothetical protein KC620_00115 [Myxococcales bacterium]|nr:hypothetical protein [Myxococcales bacterium]